MVKVGSNGGHFNKFNSAFGKATNENFRPPQQKGKIWQYFCFKILTFPESVNWHLSHKP